MGVWWWEDSGSWVRLRAAVVAVVGVTVPRTEQLVLCSGRDGREGVVCVRPSPGRLAHCPRDASSASDVGTPMLAGSMGNGGGMFVLEMLRAGWFDPGSKIVVSGSV